MHPSPLKYLSLWVASTIFFMSGSIPVFADSNPAFSAQEKLAKLEIASGGRLGVAAINTANNARIEYRANERFPMCSTNKVMGVAAILKKSTTDSHLLAQNILYKKEDLTGWSPITEKHIADGMTIFKLCEATLTASDNTAINLLMKEIGGPEGVTAFARSIGDHQFRLDRWEPELNSAIPGDPRDTTTPAAMAESLQRLALGHALAGSQQNQLVTWMKANTTGNEQIRAGVTKSWVVADKTGSGDYGTTNDIGVIWPSHCSPLVIAIYFTQNKKDASKRKDILASATRIVMNEYARTDHCMRLLSAG